MFQMMNFPSKLLLIDDDPAIVRLLSRIIERRFEGRIELASLVDSEVARQQIDEQVVDILITDLEMPNVDGLDLLRQAKRKNACTQVMFITGHSSLDALTEALESGANDYLLKPLAPEQVVTLIEAAQERLLRWREALAATLHACSAPTPIQTLRA